MKIKQKNHKFNDAFERKFMRLINLFFLEFNYTTQMLVFTFLTAKQGK